MNPNPGFKKQLATWEEVLRARGHYETPIIEEVVDGPNKESGPSKDDTSTDVKGSADLSHGEISSKMNGSDEKEQNDVNSYSSSVNSSTVRKSGEVLGDNTHSNSHAVVDEKSE